MAHNPYPSQYPYQQYANTQPNPRQFEGTSPYPSVLQRYPPAQHQLQQHQQQHQPYPNYPPSPSPEPRSSRQQFPPVPLQIQTQQPYVALHSPVHGSFATQSQPSTPRPSQPFPDHSQQAIRSDNTPYASPVSPTRRRPLPKPQVNNAHRTSTAPSVDTPGSSAPAPSPLTQQTSRHRPGSSLSFTPARPQQTGTSLVRNNTVAPSTSPPRPLPNPARASKSVDLPRSSSPTKTAGPSSNGFTPSTQSAFEQGRSDGQKFVPLWKRALPTPSSPAREVPMNTSVAGRRGVTSPVRLQDPTTQTSHRLLPSSPGGTPIPIPSSSSSESSHGSPSSGSISNSLPTTSPTGSTFSRLRNRSRALPGPSGPAPTAALPSRPISILKKSNQPEPVSSSDDDDIGSNSLLTRRTPSPTYGIRDLPQRTKSMIQTQPAVSASRAYLPPSRSKTTSSRSSSPHQSSSTFRIAASQAEPPPPVPRHPAISGSAPKGLPPTPSSAPANSSRWPTNLPRLPNPPTSPAVSQTPRSPSPTWQPASPRNFPTRKQSLRNPVSDRHNRPSPPNLDDAPPLPLRRTPSPDGGRSRFPIGKKSAPPLPHPRAGASPLPPNGDDQIPRESVFSLSEFPRPPTQVPLSPSKGNFSHRPPRTNDERPQSSRTAIPKISFPGSADSEPDEDGPVIVISDAPVAPQITINAPNDTMPQVPNISIGGVDEMPQISVSGPSSSSRTQLPPPPAVKGKGGLVCGGCGGPIIGRIVSAMGARWHPGCFRCSTCNELLENLSSYEHEGRPYCHLDYHEKFAPRCYHCQTAIVDELFITLDDAELGKRTYHEQHFFCAECGDPFLPPGTGNRSFSGDGVFKGDEDNVGFTVYRGHPYCEACHVRLRMPKCKKCKRSIRDGMQAVEALGGKWCWECFTCSSCERPFENPSFFLRNDKALLRHCFSIMIRNEL